MTTYAELTTQIISYTETSTDILTSTITDDFIEHTENRIMRDIDLPIFHSQQYSALTSSSPFLTLPGGSTQTPESFILIRSVHIYPASGTATRTYLEQRDLTFMNEYWPTRTSTGTPKYWSNWDFNTIYLAPTPDSAYNVELGINRLPARLSSSNTTTWVGNNAPTLLLYGCLVEAFKYLKGPVEMLQLYEQSYTKALQELGVEQQGRRRRDEYMHGVPRIPIESPNP
jgi:hypothetical protein|tara:strand:+ start:138 stop:821 length:684 start_codon:yes stop_codon:yes gene_type:complete